MEHTTTNEKLTVGTSRTMHQESYESAGESHNGAQPRNPGAGIPQKTVE
jgi:hypothetical protein